MSEALLLLDGAPLLARLGCDAPPSAAAAADPARRDALAAYLGKLAPLRAAQLVATRRAWRVRCSRTRRVVRSLATLTQSITARALRLARAPKLLRLLLETVF